MAESCSRCAKAPRWQIEWGVRDIQREPPVPHVLSCNEHLGPVLESRMPESFRVTHRTIAYRKQVEL